MKTVTSIINDIHQRIYPPTKWILLVYVLFFVLCYCPVLLIPFAFSDDYFFLSFSQQDHDFPLQYWAMFVTAGRPFFALFWWLYSRCVHNAADLVFLRLLGIISLSALTFSIYKLMLWAGWRRSRALLTPVIMCTMPAFQVYIAWASISCTIILTLIAGGSVYIAEKAYAEQAGIKKWSLWLLSVTVLLIALAVTQCNPMFFWVFVAILLFRPNNNTSDYLGRFVWYLTIFTCSCAADFLIAEVGKAIYGTQSIAIERTHLTHHVWKKIIWFFTEPLTHSLNFQQLIPSSRLAICLGALILIGLVLYFRGNPIKLLIALSLVPLCYLPNLVIAESWASYRTTAALSAILVLYALFALHGFWQIVLHNKYYPALTTVFVVFTMISGIITFHNVFVYFALPQAVELRLLKTTFSPGVSQKRILAVWNRLIFAPRLRYDEFGCQSMSQPAIEEHMLFVARHEK